MIPKLVYHISPRRNKESILSKGLLPKQPTDIREPAGIYLIKKFADIEKQFKGRLKLLDKFHNNKSLILATIDTELLDGGKFIESPFGKIGNWMIIYQDIIPPSAIVTVDDIDLSGSRSYVKSKHQN